MAKKTKLKEKEDKPLNKENTTTSTQIRNYNPTAKTL